MDSPVSQTIPSPTLQYIDPRALTHTHTHTHIHLSLHDAIHVTLLAPQGQLGCAPSVPQGLPPAYCSDAVAFTECGEQRPDELPVVNHAVLVPVKRLHSLPHNLGCNVDAHAVECVQQLYGGQRAALIGVYELKRLQQPLVADAASVVLELELGESHLQRRVQVAHLPHVLVPPRGPPGLLHIQPRELRQLLLKAPVPPVLHRDVAPAVTVHSLEEALCVVSADAHNNRCILKLRISELAGTKLVQLRKHRVYESSCGGELLQRHARPCALHPGG
mmetsp:Transcript_30084/g.66648  ORF Transcript_30084/g.66648 Transcript_30084/m.66648 type:complete len:275 (-) Transcript_30084:30-854(-)